MVIGVNSPDHFWKLTAVAILGQDEQMAVFIEKLAGERIIVATFRGKISDQDMVECVTQAAELSGESQRSLFRVVDLGNTGTAYAEIVSAILELTRGDVGAAVMPETTYLFVGKPQMGSYFAERRLQFFTDVSQAVSCIHAEQSELLAI
jgi:hypothetical protein